MKLKYLVIALFLLSCSTKQENNSDLWTIDVSKTYPAIPIDRNDIAEFEYIALQTDENTLLRPPSFLFLKTSPDYIITFDGRAGDIFLFNRQGELIRKINKKGGGGEQYAFIFDIVVDFEKEEIYVYDGPGEHLWVYSFLGTYIKTINLPIESGTRLSSLYNYDNDYIICRCDDTYSETDNKTDFPYRLISKKDGTMTNINLAVKKPFSHTVYEGGVSENNSASENRKSITMNMNYMLKNGDEYLIADQGLDTIYSFKQGIFTPLFVKTPSVEKTDNTIVIEPKLFTDKFFCFSVIDCVYDPSDPQKINDRKDLLLNRETGEITYNLIRDYDASHGGQFYYSPATHKLLSAESKNIGFSYYSYLNLGIIKERKIMTNELEEVYKRMEMEDNDIIVIWKFK